MFVYEVRRDHLFSLTNNVGFKHTETKQCGGSLSFPKREEVRTETHCDSDLAALTHCVTLGTIITVCAVAHWCRGFHVGVHRLRVHRLRVKENTATRFSRVDMLVIVVAVNICVFFSLSLAHLY